MCRKEKGRRKGKLNQRCPFVLNGGCPKMCKFPELQNIFRGFTLEELFWALP